MLIPADVGLFLLGHPQRQEAAMAGTGGIQMANGLIECTHLVCKRALNSEVKDERRGIYANLTKVRDIDHDG
jgi:hypothetical protein